MPFSRINLQGELIDFNDEYFAMCGYSRHQLMGKSHQMIFDGSMPSALMEHGYQRLRQGKPFCLPFRGRSKEGQIFWRESYFMPLVKAGQVFAFGALYHPLDAALQQRAERFYDRFEVSAPVGRGKFRDWIPALRSYLPGAMLCGLIISSIGVGALSADWGAAVFAGVCASATKASTKYPDSMGSI